MTLQNILVVGATGKQGRAVVNALLKNPNNAPHILALTRNPDSANAQSLLSAFKDGQVELVKGDTGEPKAIFEGRPKDSIDGIFIVTVMQQKLSEEQQAIPLIDTAVDHGVKHIVFTSVERGGNEKSWTNPTTVPHFKAKHNVEIYLRDKAAKSNGAFTWTILRPVAFMDNWNPGAFASMMTAMWASSMSEDKKLQLISVHDIGEFAALSFKDPAKWAGKAVGLAGDELTLKEVKEKFQKVTGKPLPHSWNILGKFMLWMITDLRLMFAWFDKEGYGADIAELRKEFPPLMDFETWLREESGWKEDKA